MSGAGYTSLDQIKILYEDSLRDIRELTGRLEKISSEINSSAASASSIHMMNISDAPETERNNSVLKVTGFAFASLLLCAVLFGGGGYLVGAATKTNEVSLASERARVAEAELAAVSTKANKSVEESTATLTKQYLGEIEKVRTAAGWAQTPDGRLAKKFFDLGDGAIAARCSADTWKEVEQKDNSIMCVPNRRGIFEIFGEDNAKRYGWKIPK